MSKISEIIESYILDLIEQGEGNIEIKRNELAEEFACAPSQINYVLTTRFTSSRGFIIESRRGGGGYIRITRVDIDNKDWIRGILSQIGIKINKESAHQLVDTIYKQGLINGRIRNMIITVIDDNTLSIVPKPERDNLRANILKSIIVAALVDV